jgi:hypothetical protein
MRDLHDRLTGGLGPVLKIAAVSTHDTTVARRAGFDWRRAEFILTLLAFLGFVTLGIKITTVYSDLPAHPLFVHVPVILIPTVVIAALVLMARPEWLGRYGIALSLVSIAAMSSIFRAPAPPAGPAAR